MEILGLMFFLLELKVGRMQLLKGREGGENVGWGGGSVFNMIFKEIIYIYFYFKFLSK